MPNLFQRFSHARNANGGDDPPPRPRTAAEEQLSRPATSAAAAASNETLGVGGQVQGVSMPVAADSRTPADGPEDSGAPAVTDPEQIAVGEGAEGSAEKEQQQQQAADPAAAAVAAAAALAEMQKQRLKAKAEAALKKMKSRTAFSLWRFLPTFYDPVEDTIRSRIIAVLAVAMIPAMLTGLLLEPMITDVVEVTSNKVILLSPLFLPMDPMYVGVLPVKGYEFRFVVRNAKNWPQPGSASPSLTNRVHPADALPLHRRLYIRVCARQLRHPQPRPAAAAASVRSRARRHRSIRVGRCLFSCPRRQHCRVGR